MKQTAIRFNNYARAAGRRGTNEYHEWRVFVDEPAEILDQIDEVEYVLHPTFPQPYQVRRNRQDKFALETAGWGEFKLLITVKFKDGRQERAKYSLSLDTEQKPWPTEATA